ncbi:MAG TPA: hypothetical protein PLZ17_05605 [Pseudomonadota bacterium]|nr:hypothetical protein [Pseudomonadota bacterium]
MRLVILALAILFSTCTLAQGAAAGTEPSPTDMSPAQFLAWHDQLAQDLRTRRYDYVNAAHLAEISRAQGTIHRLLDGKQSLDELSADQRAELAAANAEIHASLDDAKLDKKVCKQQHVVGSRRPRQVCQSERERRELAEQSQRNMMDRGACREGSSVTCSGG